MEPKQGTGATGTSHIAYRVSLQKQARSSSVLHATWARSPTALRLVAISREKALRTRVHSRHLRAFCADRRRRWDAGGFLHWQPGVCKECRIFFLQRWLKMPRGRRGLGRRIGVIKGSALKLSPGGALGVCRRRSLLLTELNRLQHE